MRKIAEPTTPDLEALERLAKSRSASAKAVASVRPALPSRYVAYLLAGGDPWTVEADPAFVPHKDDLTSLYERPPAALKPHLESLRVGLTGSCPMCGRDALGTLDHYLPKADYPEFAFFSRNLVPACDRCNRARGNNVKGHMDGVRALHPYFDRFALRRVLSVVLRPDWRAPEIAPIPFDVEGHEREIVQWQVDFVLLPSGFEEYAAPIWAKLVANPLTLLGSDPSPISIVNKLQYLEDVEAINGESPNAWRSIIYHGVRLNPDAVQFLAERVQASL
ncbi:HNH endonuclease [Roseateles sp.]|uniref:HNH endonuclease n=1 Tax=Roseateles sp. TaxID=1971397 RepID=UPI003BA3EC03